MVVLVTCKKKKKIHSKLKAEEWSQHFSNCKSIGIFPDAQGQLTPQSMVGSGQISNSSLILSLSCKRIKMMLSKIKALEWSQQYTLICKRSKASNSVIGDVIWPKFKLI